MGRVSTHDMCKASSRWVVDKIARERIHRCAISVANGSRTHKNLEFMCKGPSGSFNVECNIGLPHRQGFQAAAVEGGGSFAMAKPRGKKATMVKDVVGKVNGVVTTVH